MENSVKEKIAGLRFQVTVVPSAVLMVFIFVMCSIGKVLFWARRAFWCSTSSGHCVLLAQRHIASLESSCFNTSEVLLHPTIVLSLQVPQHYKLMGYQPVSVYDALHSYITPNLARPLQSAPPVTKQVTTNRSKSAKGPNDVYLNPLFLGWASVWWGPVSTNSAPKSPGGGSCQSPPHCCCFKHTRICCETFFYRRLMLLLCRMLVKLFHRSSLEPHPGPAAHWSEPGKWQGGSPQLSAQVAGHIWKL